MNIKASGGTSEWKRSSAEGRKEGWKEEMDESCSQQTALAARAGSEPTAEGSCKACWPSLPTRPARQQRQHGDYTLGKETRRSRLTLNNPKLIPQQTFPIHYRPLFFINQTCQTQRLEHSGSAYSKHRTINMETTDPRRITGWVRYIYIPPLVMPPHTFHFLEILSV